MPWHCPACQSIIRHIESESSPRVGERYRCHVCRLTLEYLPAVDKLMITSADADHAIEPHPPRAARTVPSPVTTRRKKSRSSRKKDK